MAALIPGLPDLPALRSLIITELQAANLLGTYTFPNGTTDPAVSVEGIIYSEPDEGFPPTGTTIAGLEVVITPATDIPVQPTLDGYTQFFRHTITLKQWSGDNKTLQAYQTLQRKLGNIYSGSAIRQLPSLKLDAIEQLSFELEQVVFIPDEVQLYDDTVLIPPPGGEGGTVTTYERTFTEADLTIAGLLPVTHNLNSYPSAIGVFDNNTEQIQPDKIDILSPNTLSIDVSSYRPLTGVWTVSIVI